MKNTLFAILTVSLYSLASGPTSSPTHAQIQQKADKQSDRHQSKAEILSRKIDEKIRKENEQEEKFMLDFLSLPPRERVKLWKERKDVTGRGLILRRMDDALIARGVDAVPYLAEVVRQGNSYNRVRALEILCEMDRFVLVEEMAVPELKGRIHVKSLNIAGRLDPFMVVDGRRIGKDGYEFLRWAAEHTKDKGLRFHARRCTGLLEQDLQSLSLQEQVKLWREAVIKNKGMLGLDVEGHYLSDILKEVLVAHAPESIPFLIDILDGDPNGYVREEALRVITLIDICRMRLRATEAGRAAIEAVHRTLEKGELKPVYSKATRQEKEDYWKWFSAKVFDDDITLHHGSQWAVIAIALEALYGIKVTKRYKTTPEIQVIEAIPEMRQFVTYLTRVDRFFPSWEYTYIGVDEVMHPRFKQKIARYYEQWRRFKAEQG
jgi:hypothetical protein